MTSKPVEMLLAELAGRGIELKAYGDKLRFRPRAAMTPDLAERLQTHKSELLAVLQRPVSPAAEAEAMIQRALANADGDLAEALAEAWAERLSICTADGLTLAEAEAVALIQLQSVLAFQRSRE